MRIYSVLRLLCSLAVILVTAGRATAIAEPSASQQEFRPIEVSELPGPVVPSSKEQLVVDGIRFDELVNILGPARMSEHESVGILRWHFDDGAVLCTWGGSADQKLNFGQSRGMWWQYPPTSSAAEVVKPVRQKLPVAVTITEAQHGRYFPAGAIIVAGLLIISVYWMYWRRARSSQ